MEISGNREEAQELTSDVMMKVFRNIGSYNPEKAPFSVWVLTIARNEAITYLRRLRAEPPKCDIRETGDIYDKQEDDGDIADRVKEAIERCSPPERELINLYYYDNLQLRDISEITGVTAGALAVRLARIRKKIKQYIENKHG